MRTYINAKLRALTGAGHQAVVIAPGRADAEQEKAGGKIVWLASPVFPLDPRYRVFAGRAKLRSALIREQPDVLECSSPWTGTGVCAAWERARAKALFLHQDPVAVYGETLLRGMDPSLIDRLFGWYRARVRRLSARFDVTVVGSHWYAGRLRRYGLSSVEAIPLGITREPFLTAAPDPAVRARLLAACGQKPDARLVVAVSRHHPEKRLGTLIEACALASSGRPLGLVIYGDGPLRGWVERRAARAGNVHVAGFARDRRGLATAVASADVLLHGSSAETFGIAVAEALTAGTPVVMPRQGASADMADPACTELYDAGDSVRCAEALLRMLDRAPTVGRAEVRQRAAGTVPDADDHFARLIDLYSELARGARGT